jgi:hypothetical protein
MAIKVKSIIVLLSVTFLISSCGSGKEAAHKTHNGDLQEQTASADVLPSFLTKQPDQIRLVYQAAGHASSVLQFIPCYCGCGESAGHTSNMNCFYKEIKKDGSIVWDDHGTRCNVCLQIAAKSIQMQQEGKPLKEIRAYIDNTYKEGYAKPTKTL